MNVLLPNLDSSNLLTFWSFADEDVVTLLPLPQAVNEISMVKIKINFIIKNLSEIFLNINLTCSYLLKLRLIL